ncbi:MAG: Gfo/Idh/MocA family protein [Planctomycetota bacterium]
MWFLLERRHFLKRTAALGACGFVPYWLSTPAEAEEEKSKAKNDRLRIGWIGAGGRGTHVIQQAARYGDVVAIADADLKHADRGKALFEGKPKVYQDYRQLLDGEKVDVIVNATPDHWHTAVNLDACRAGKDVYTEKPLTLTIEEGKMLRQVVHDTGSVVQVGTQRRSMPPVQRGVEVVRNGRLGKLKQVWVALPWYSTKGGPFETVPVPESLDWDMYQGQAPVHDYYPERTHKTFRWFYEYAGGIITDWGNHIMDVAHWGMDRELSGPVSVEARGQFPNPEGTEYFNTPDRFFSRMVYPDGVEVLFFSALRLRRTYGTEKAGTLSDADINQLFGRDVPDEIKQFDRHGVMFIGDKGRIFVNVSGAYGKPVEELAENPLPSEAWRARPSKDHMKNFVECVKRREQPVAPVDVEHRSVTACHLTNISLRLGRPLTWDPDKEEFPGDEEANQYLDRRKRAPYTLPGMGASP